jgi:hypothetical protein
VSSKLSVFFGNGGYSPTKVGEHIKHSKEGSKAKPAKEEPTKGVGLVPTQTANVSPKKRKA